MTTITVRPTSDRFPCMVPELMLVWEVTAHLFNRCRKEGREFTLDNRTPMEL